MYSYDYSTTYENPLTNGEIAAISTVSAIFGLIVVAVEIFFLWKVFEKAGKPGWAAIVPLYNAYVLFEITWGNGWYCLFCLLPIIPAIGSIAFVVILVITYVKLAKAFGKSGGFAVGLLFLNIIFTGILAFDSSTYLGAPKKEENQNPTPAPQPQPAPTPEVEPNRPVSYCSNCGTALPEGTAFCPNCGTQKTN